MQEGNPVTPGLCERLWRRHFAAFADPELREPRVLICEGQPPTLAYPARYDATQRELSFGWAMPTYFGKVYGDDVLERALLNYEALAAAVAAPRLGCEDRTAD